MKSHTLRKTYLSLSKELQLASISFYALSIGIGMLFNYFKYSRYGINIFDYSDLLDFLLIPFSDIRILLATALSLLVAYGVYRFDTWWLTKYPEVYSKFNFGFDRKNWFKLYRKGTFIFISLLYLGILANLYGALLARNLAKSDFRELVYEDNQSINIRQIGKTKDVVFALDRENRVLVLPIANIKVYRIQ